MEGFTGGWLVGRTKPLQEKYAMTQVLRQGYEAYLPRQIDTRTKRIEPLFPGYLFVKTEGPWRWLRSTFGMLDVVYGSGGLPARLPEGAVDDLRSREDSKGLFQAVHKFAQGQKVRLLDGPFTGWNAIYSDSPARSRERVLLNILGAWTPVVVRESWVEAVA